VHSFRVSSALRASPAEVWARAATIDGVNAELAPFARMTTPGEGVIREGALGRSWILLGGVLPVDYDDLRLEAVEPGRGFRERSVLGSCSAWHHDRTLHPLAGGGTRVVDELSFAPRLRAAGGLQALVFEAAFRWRHRRLRAIWGAV
jgi:ligand-binding SRPBCC domain-containing protein